MKIEKHDTFWLLSDINNMSVSKMFSSGIWLLYRESSGVLNGRNFSAKGNKSMLGVVS